MKCASVKYTSTMHASPVGTPKPPHLFDRDAEWTGLVSFAADARPGATLGVVSGRRRQGKSYLLQGLATALGGIYFPALELTETVSLRLFADELIRFSGLPVPPFRLPPKPCNNNRRDAEPSDLPGRRSRHPNRPGTSSRRKPFLRAQLP